MSLRSLGLAGGLVTAIAASTLLAAPANALSIPELPNHFSRFILEDTKATTGKRFIAVDDKLNGVRETTVGDAENAADDFFDLPKANTSGQPIVDLDSGESVRSDAALPGGVGYADADYTKPGFLWDVDASGVIRSDTGAYLGFDDASGHLAATDTPRYRLAGSSTGQTATPISAHVDSVDAAKGEAILSGTANSSVVNDVRVGWGSSFVTTSDSGRWVALITGLKPGTNTVELTQTVDGKKADTLPVVVTVGDDAPAFRPLAVTSGHTFPGTPVTTIRGTATPNATVDAVVFGVKTTVPVKADGTWEYKRGFNNALNYTVDFTQHAGDKTDSISGWKIGPAVDETFQPLAVTSGHTFPGTPVTTVRGTATPNATVDAVVFGITTTVKVSPQGTWEYKRGFNNALNYTVDFTQHAGDKTDAVTGWKIGPAA